MEGHWEVNTELKQGKAVTWGKMLWNGVPNGRWGGAGYGGVGCKENEPAELRGL